MLTQVSFRRDTSRTYPFFSNASKFQKVSSFTRSKRDPKVGTSLPLKGQNILSFLARKSPFEGTLRILSPEKILIRDIPMLEQVSFRRDSSYFFLRVKKKNLFEGTFHIPSPEKILIRDTFLNRKTNINIEKKINQKKKLLFYVLRIPCSYTVFRIPYPLFVVFFFLNKISLI